MRGSRIDVDPLNPQRCDAPSINPRVAASRPKMAITFVPEDTAEWPLLFEANYWAGEATGCAMSTELADHLHTNL